MSFGFGMGFTRNDPFAGGPSLNLQFAGNTVLDPSITFTRALNTATYFNSAGLLTTANANVPRFDYDPVTLAPRGLLIEEQRTNLLTYSEDFNGGTWSRANLTITPNATTSPSGATNAQRVTATATAATSLVQDQVVNATSAAFTVYAKQGSGATDMNVFVVRNVTTSTNLLNGTLNYSTGVWTYVTGSTGVSITNVGNGWWRIEMSVTSGITSGNTIRPYIGSSGGSFNAGVFAYFWGAQLEAGSFATSYIPTVASQVTRNADVASITGANFSNWFNASAGSFVTDVADSLGTTPRTMSVYGASSNEQLAIGFDITRVRSGGVDIGSFYANQSITGKRAVAYATNEQAAAKDGAALSSTNTGLPSGLASLWIGQTNTGAAILNGHIRRITYYPRRLSNAELQSITS